MRHAPLRLSSPILTCSTRSGNQIRNSGRLMKVLPIYSQVRGGAPCPIYIRVRSASQVLPKYLLRERVQSTLLDLKSYRLPLRFSSSNTTWITSGFVLSTVIQSTASVSNALTLMNLHSTARHGTDIRLHNNQL